MISAHACRDAAVEAVLAQSGRRGRHVGVRRAFVQRGPLTASSPGVLCDFVRRHDERALDLYLLLRAKASAAPWTVHLPAVAWARCLGLDEASGARGISKVWGRLVEKRLVARSRAGRWADIAVLHEDGSGAPYEPPGGSASEPYFRLPFTYWTSDERYYRTLDLPAKAMLLIALSLKDGAELPLARVPAWYGLSEDSAGRGLAELEARGLVKVRVSHTPAPLTVTGYHEHRHISVDRDFRSGGST